MVVKETLVQIPFALKNVLKLDNVQLCETQIEQCKVREYDADTLPGSYPHRKYMVCMV